MPNDQPRNPLHGVKLADILDALHTEFGWEGLAKRIDINCFKKDPTFKSSLRFLRKTQFARKKVERLYLDTFPDGLEPDTFQWPDS